MLKKTNRKRIVVIVLCLALIFSCLGVFAACDDHQWSTDGYNEYTHSLSCLDCGYSMNETHKVNEDGVCSVCGYQYHDHDWVLVASDENSHEFFCEACGLSKVRKHAFGAEDKCVDCSYSKPIEKPTEPSNPDGTQKTKVYFGRPVEFTSISLTYTSGVDEDLFVFNPTLGWWTTHYAVDLDAPDGTVVVAMFDGVVVDVNEDIQKGYYVTIDHGDGVVATYASLNDIRVAKNQQIKKGDLLGVVSTSAGNECENGAHLHLEVYKDGKVVDPMPYVNGEIYREIEID